MAQRCRLGRRNRLPNLHFATGRIVADDGKYVSRPSKVVTYLTPWEKTLNANENETRLITDNTKHYDARMYWISAPGAMKCLPEWSLF